jgi:hypothetical protein
MSMEIINHCKEKLQDYTGLSLRLTRIEFIDTSLDTLNNNFLYSEESGCFIPRSLLGFVKHDSNPLEALRKSLHEISHGLYLENFPKGIQIVECDRAIADAEKRLFGRMLGGGEKILVIASKIDRGAHSFESVKGDVSAFLKSKGIELINYETVIFSNLCDFEEYKSKRASLRNLFENDLEDQEGFCTLMEVEGLSDTSMGAEILRRYMEANDVYGKGFKKVKGIMLSSGISGIIKFFKEGGGRYV